jgi:micrococcal nuclease
MKKIIVVFILIFLCYKVYAEDRDILSNIECIDGDTIKASINGEENTIRFIGIDTPETKYSTKDVDEPYAQEASDYTCNSVMSAKIVEIEYDSNSDKSDKYGRILGWIFVDGNLLQKELVYNGLARVKYIYDDYKYLNEINEAEQYAKDNKLGIWSDSKEADDSEKTIIDKISDYCYKIVKVVCKVIKILIKKLVEGIKYLFKKIIYAIF